MQYIPIKKSIKNEKEYYSVAAIPLKNTNKSVVQKIPHPLGTDVILFETLEQAKESIKRAGFNYILPDGQKGVQLEKITQDITSYEEIVLNAVKNKINSQNSSVSAAAIVSIAEFPSDETFDILFEKLGEDNDQIRKNAISGICRYGNLLVERIIKALNSENWVTRNSALTCILNLAEDNKIDLEPFIIPLAKTCNDSNTIVQSNAIITIGKVYKQYRKNN